MFAFLTQASAGDPLGTRNSVHSLLSRVIPLLSSVVLQWSQEQIPKDPEAGFWKLVPPHFPGSALWPGSGVSSGSRAVSMVDALQIRGHPALEQA